MMSGNNSEREVQRPPTLLSLQDSAINTIVKNIGGYRDLIKKKIAPPMRKILFDQAMERIEEIGGEQVWAALPYLDQHRTAESFSTKEFASIFRLKGKTGAISEACVSMEEFLQYLLEFVPNLRELIIEDPRTPLNRKIYNKIQLQPLASDLLLKIEHLTRVSIIDVYINFSEFVSVCRYSGKLKSIQANNILVDIEPNSIKDFLKRINWKFEYQEYDARKIPRKFGIKLEKKKIVTYREAKVSLANDFHDMFPAPLTKLQIFGQEDKDLGFLDILCERDRFLRILRSEGEYLKILILQSMRPELNIKFKHIFDHCNELQTLQLHDSNVSDNDPIASFGQLKILKWDKTFQRECPVRLHRIFNAPLLEIMYIVAYKIDIVDKQSLLRRIGNRTILTNCLDLCTLCLTDQAQEDLYELAFKLRRFYALRQVSLALP